MNQPVTLDANRQPVPVAEHKPVPVTGYRSLSQAEIDLMNEAKALGVQLGEFIDRLMASGTCDNRWVAIGKTQMQQGLMAVIRGIAQPTTF